MMDEGGRMLKMTPQALHCTRLARPAFSSATAIMPPPKQCHPTEDFLSLTTGLWPSSVRGLKGVNCFLRGDSVTTEAAGTFAPSGVLSTEQTVASFDILCRNTDKFSSRVE